jgi:ribosomal-protein-alanine N-acetyltransferase
VTAIGDPTPAPSDATIDPAALSIEICPMRRRHLRAVLRIEAANRHRPWSLGLFMSELGMKTGRVYAVARSGQAVVGFAGLMFSGGDAHVTTISVREPWRRAGVGRRLMLLLARQARMRGSDALTLEVRAENTAAQGLYRAFGLAPAGVRKNYYSDLGEDALIMWVHDIDTDEYAQRLDRIEAAVVGATKWTGWPTGQEAS